MNLAKLLTGSNTSVAMIVWSLIIGVFLAMAISVYNKMTVGRLVKKLLDVKANTVESAKSLSELGFKDNSYSYALRPSSTLSSIIHRTEDKKLYIPEDKSYRAETTFVSGSINPVAAVISVVLLLAAGIGLNNLIPYILKLANGIF